MNKRGLGKGLGALLPSNFNLGEDEQKPRGQILELKIKDIKPNLDQPRKAIEEDKLEELAASIKEHGIVQPIIVLELDNGEFQIVAGERRWRACQLLKMDTIPAIIQDYSPQEILEIALIENIQREDLNPVEEGRAYKTLIEVHGLTQEELAQRIGKSRSFIANMIRLLNLSPLVLEMLQRGEISVGHGRALLPLPEDGQITLARRIIRESLSVRDTERLVKGIIALVHDEPVMTGTDKDDAKLEKIFLADYQDRLRERLGTKVEINQQGERGKIIIEYYNADDLDRVLGFFLEDE